MVILLITSVLLFTLIAAAIYLWQKPSRTSDSMELPMREARSLFDNPEEILEMSDPHDVEDQRKAVFERASSGEKESLVEATKIDSELYDNCLNSLLTQCEHASQLQSLLSYIVRHELSVNTNLATAFIALWQSSPERGNTAKMLHVAALSDDAETYRKAVELILTKWREGKLPDISAIELQSLFSSEFWVLSSRTRSSGAGFLLKRTLSSVQRELNDPATD